MFEFQFIANVFLSKNNLYILLDFYFLKGVRYQYMVVPYSPTKQTTFTASPMSVMAMTTSGTPMYNPLSSSNGSLASYYEWSTLDPCYGHSDADKQYHYHAVLLSLLYYLYFNYDAYQINFTISILNFHDGQIKFYVFVIHSRFQVALPMPQLPAPIHRLVITLMVFHFTVMLQTLLEQH